LNEGYLLIRITSIRTARCTAEEVQFTMATKRHPHLSQVFGGIFLAVLSLAAIFVLQSQELKTLQGENVLSDEELERQVEAEQMRLELLKKTPAFGYDNILADWLLLNFFQYFGDEPARLRTGFSLSPDYFDVIIQRDPYYRFTYVFLSTSTSMFAALPERAIALMDEGLSKMTPTVPPDGFFVWRQKGIDELLFLGDGKAAQQSFETAAAWADQSPLPEAASIAAISRQTAQFLATNPDSRAAQIGAWAMVYTNAIDDRTRDLALDHIHGLGGQIIVGDDGTIRIRLPNGTS
jgi:hypothetical protein